jgi:transcriptional regulator with XRE-family HTH domain
MPQVEHSPTEQKLRETIVERIKMAHAEAKRADRRKGRAWLENEMQVSHSTMIRILKGESDPSAVEIWRLAQATKKPFAWFAGEADPAEARLAAATERAERSIHDVEQQLGRLLVDLAEARAFFAKREGEAAIDAATASAAAHLGRGEGGSHDPGESVAVPREAAG